ncbi:MAG: tetratricopeptide repeat protein [Methanobacterium sp.]
MESEQMTSKDVEIFYNQAMSLFKMGEFKKSLELFNRALYIDDKFIPAWNNKGVIHMELEEYSQALDCFDKLTFIDMTDDLTWYNKGYVLLLLKRYQESIRTFEYFLAKYTKKDDYYKYALYLEAKCYYEVKDYDKSIQLLKVILSFDESFSEAQELQTLVLKDL